MSDVVISLLNEGLKDAERHLKRIKELAKRLNLVGEFSVGSLCMRRQIDIDQWKMWLAQERQRQKTNECE